MLNNKFNKLVKARNGYCLYNTNDIYIGKSIENYGEFSHHEATLFYKLCKLGDTVVEVGSNIGVHTQVLANIVSADGKVIAFEPQRLSFQTLCSNIAINSIVNVQAYNYAVGQKEDKIVVPDLNYNKPNNFGGISLENISKGEEVTQVTLDNFVKDIDNLSFIKIDVEGMESDVLKGSQEIISKFKPKIYIENDRQEKSKDLIELLWSMGYELYWHLPPLYNQNNFFKNSKNIFPNIISVNMLCIHKDDKENKDLGLKKVLDSSFHPMAKKDYKSDDKYLEEIKNAQELLAKNKTDEALDKINELLKKDYKTAEVYNLLGIINSKSNHFQKAVDAYQEAIKIEPSFIHTYHNFGALLKGLKNYKDALDVYVMGVKQAPNDENLHNNIGMVFESLGQNANAIEAYKNAVRLNPKFAKAINNIAVVLYKQKRYKESSDMFELALKTDPDYKEVYSNLGAALNRQKRYDESIKALETAIKKIPKGAGAYTNLGNVYNKLHDYKKAQKLHEKSISLEPNGSNAYANLGSSLKNQGQVKRSIESYKKAISIDTDFVNAHFDLATSLLTISEFSEGFSEYEWRFKKDEMLPHIAKYKEIFSKPMLTKDSNAKGKTLLVHSEQGFGDSIMFIRFLPKIKEKFNCNIIFKARDELVHLFENSCDIDEVVYRSGETPRFDFHLPIMSAAYVLDIQKEEEFGLDSYLDVNLSKALFEIENKDKKPKIGICWSASVTGESYDGKVFDLKYLEPLIKSDKLDIYSFQVGDGKEDISKYSYENDIIDLSDKLINFEQTAILAKNMDLVISSDTSVAHLCGALGVKTWTILQKYPDWRWKNRGDKSYMYGSMKLIRQKHNRNWDTVFQSLYDRIQREFKIKI